MGSITLGLVLPSSPPPMEADLMLTFKCTCPGNPGLYFENSACNACECPVGFIDATMMLVPLTKVPNGFKAQGDLSERIYSRCKNGTKHNICNGYYEAGSLDGKGQPETLCYACHFNNVIPDLHIKSHLSLWRNVENAKRRTLFTINRMGLPTPDAITHPNKGLEFNFPVDKDVHDHFRTRLPGISPVFTGHANGVITINLAEADDVARTRSRINMDEQYRTLLGHFRHEIGHFYWDLLIKDNEVLLEQFRHIFGDDTLDYQKAMKRHYDKGAPDNWTDDFVSAYATMHPWEDWAETWAHYLHMMDTLETATSHNLAELTLATDGQHIFEEPIEQVTNCWTVFTIKLNALNRSMGMPDAYPFALNSAVYNKLAFIDSLLKNCLVAD